MGRGQTTEETLGTPRGALGKLRALDIPTAELEVELERAGLDDSCLDADALVVNERSWLRSLRLSAGDAEVLLDGLNPLADAEQFFAILPEEGGHAALEIALRAYLVGHRHGYEKDRDWED